MHRCNLLLFLKATGDSWSCIRQKHVLQNFIPKTSYVQPAALGPHVAQSKVLCGPV